MSANQLAQATSPYLLLHKDNPVHWRVWGKEAFAEAEASGKPILLSIGYTACHWCHVMNEESFTDPETAALMNELYVNVKVDREERPDIDQVYQAAASTMGHSGGWPLTIFLTSDAKPFFVAGFLPKEPRYGYPPFKTVLRETGTLFAEHKDDVARNVAVVGQQLEAIFNRDTRGWAEKISLEFTAMRVAQRFDIFFGGFTGGAKFPNTPVIDVLWRAYLRTGAMQFLQLVTTTIDNMLNGGLYDHVGGGFMRYTVDEEWTLPHFEKMLYDNALLIDLMSGFWQFNRNETCRIRVDETIAWMLRELKVGDGFASGLDASTDGEEGKFYLWRETEIDAVLAGTYVSRFKSIYNVTRDGNFNGCNHLNRLKSAHLNLSDADEALLAKQRALLLAARDKRVRPMRDDKLLADWNGLAIAALANAGAVFERPDWISSAILTFDHIVATMGEGDRLFHSWISGKRGADGFSDDYAHMARAALQLWEVTGDARFLDYAQKWVGTLNTHFWDEARGGYFFTGDDADPLIVRVRMLFDQPVPSANGTMLTVLTRLWLATGDGEYAGRASALVQAFADDASNAPISCGSFLGGYEYFATALEIVVIGPNNHPKTHELARAVWGRALPNRLLRVLDPDAALPAGHVVSGKTMQGGQPTAYICQRGSCTAPITNPVTLGQMLQLPPRAAGSA